jgi:hypothetical protein
VRYLHYSLRTEAAYVHWVRAYVRFHGTSVHPREMGAAEVEAFLTWLANERQVAVSTHGHALPALLFLYQKVQGMDLPWLQGIGRPKRQPRPPVVMSPDKVRRVLVLLDGVHKPATPHTLRPRSPRICCRRGSTALARRRKRRQQRTTHCRQKPGGPSNCRPPGANAGGRMPLAEAIITPPMRACSEPTS